MTDGDKDVIIILFHLQYSLGIISRIMGRPWCTIRNFIVREAQKNTIENAVRSGRPQKLSGCDRWAIMRALRIHSKQTWEQLHRGCGFEDHVVLRTIDRYLCSQKLMKWLTKKCPKLTPERAAQQLI